MNNFICILLTFSFLFVSYTLCQSTRDHIDICELPGCRCNGDDVYEIKCRCDQQNQVIDLHETIQIPTSVRDFEISGCPSVYVFRSGLSDAELDTFHIIGCTNVTIGPGSIHLSRSIRLENIRQLTLEIDAFSYIEARTLLLRNVTTEILAQGVISPSSLNDATFLNCTFGHGLDQGAISLSSPDSVSFVDCNVGKLEKNAITIVKGNRFYMTDSRIDDIDKDAISIQAEEVLFRNNDFNEIPKNLFQSMFQDNVTRSFTFLRNSLHSLETVSAFDIGGFPSRSHIDNNRVNCSCPTDIAKLQSLRQNPAAGIFLSKATCLRSQQRFEDFLQDPKCSNSAMSFSSTFPLLLSLLVHKLLAMN